WLQTMDSCKQSLGQSQFDVLDTSAVFDEVVTTPAAPLHGVGSGTCPAPRGDCVTTTDGCVQITAVPFSDTFRIRQTAMPPANTGDPLGYAPCNGGGACRNECVNFTVSSAGVVTAQTTNVYPDGTTSVLPSSTTMYAGTQSDPIVFHD